MERFKRMERIKRSNGSSYEANLSNTLNLLNILNLFLYPFHCRYSNAAAAADMITRVSTPIKFAILLLV